MVFDVDDREESISMVKNNGLSYVELERFYQPSGKSMEINIGVQVVSKPWKQKKNLVDNVHKHVYGHSSLTEYHILFERNNLWEDDVKRYVLNIIENCNACRSSALPKPNRKVSISALAKEFNEIVCIDHLFLEAVCIVHHMDHVTRYSAGMIVPDTKLANAITA